MYIYFSARKLATFEGEKALLECELVDSVLKKTGGQANYVTKLDWTKSGAIVASYFKVKSEKALKVSRYEARLKRVGLGVL